jgi:hypothetical protein
MKLSNFKMLVFVAMVALLVLPVVGCAPKAPPPPPPPPPAGTLTVDPAKIDVETLKKYFPPIAKALGLPEAMAATVPHLAMLAIPVKFKGAGWQPKEVITIDLVVPPDVEMTGLDRTRGEDSIGIAFANADDKGNFEANLEKTATIGFILRGGFLPTLAPDPKTLIPGNPLPNGTYTLKAMGEDTRSVATTTWQLELVAPLAPPPAAPPAAAPSAPGKLSFEAAEYTNAEVGFSVKYPKDWKQDKSETLLFYAASPSMVPVIFVDAEEGATFAETLKKSLEAAGGSGFKVVSEKESALADGTKASTAAIEIALKGFGAKGFALGVKKDNKWILVTVGTVEMLAPYNEAKFSEIVHTLQFKK